MKSPSSKLAVNNFEFFAVDDGNVVYQKMAEKNIVAAVQLKFPAGQGRHNYGIRWKRGGRGVGYRD
jgi:hypothetical protein